MALGKNVSLIRPRVLAAGLWMLLFFAASTRSQSVTFGVLH